MNFIREISKDDNSFMKFKNAKMGNGETRNFIHKAQKLLFKNEILHSESPIKFSHMGLYE